MRGGATHGGGGTSPERVPQVRFEIQSRFPNEGKECQQVGGAARDGWREGGGFEISIRRDARERERERRSAHFTTDSAIASPSALPLIRKQTRVTEERALTARETRDSITRRPPSVLSEVDTVGSILHHSPLFLTILINAISRASSA